MRAVVQRVTSAEVSVEGTIVGGIGGSGLVILLGVTHTDTDADAERLATKIWHLRIMREERSASDLSAPLLVISQFTFYADTRKGRRPSWSSAAPGPVSEPRYEAFCAVLRSLGARVETGVFGADMQVRLCNDGPITLCVET